LNLFISKLFVIKRSYF